MAGVTAGVDSNVNAENVNIKNEEKEQIDLVKFPIYDIHSCNPP